MKNIKWLVLLAAVGLPLLSGYAQALVAQVSTDPPSTQGSANLSPGVADVIKLAESGVSEDVILSFIANSPSNFDLSADNVLYLKDLGLSSAIITAMLNHDAALRNQPQESAPAPEPAAPPPPAPEPAAPPAAYVSSPPVEVSYFYNDLSPYGSWVDLAGFGWCWQPRAVVINRAWRPYCDGGNWLYSDAGWYWQSSYSWGWAPFHYGRWHHHDRCGWVWLPGQVWGPAWVTWRVAGDRCGWAPLPPHADFDLRLGWCFNGVQVGVDYGFGLHANHFNFVAMRDFNGHDLGHHRLPPAEVTRIYNNTTIINNYAVNNNTIVNHGIPVEHVAAATHTQIRKAYIRDLPAGSGSGSRREAADKGGVVVYRPQLRSPARPTAMVAQKVDAQHPVVVHPPIAPARVERTSSGAIGRPAPVTSQRRSPTELPSGSQRPTGEKPISNPQNHPAPRSGDSAPTASSRRAPTQPPGQVQPSTRSTFPNQPASAVPARQAPTQPPGQVQPSTRSTFPNQPASAVPARQAPTQPPGQLQPTIRSTSPGQSAPATPVPPRTTRPVDEPRQGTRSTPANKADSGGYSYPPRNSVQGQPNPRAADSQGQSSHLYSPKATPQAAETQSSRPPNSRPATPPPASSKDRGSQSNKNDY